MGSFSEKEIDIFFSILFKLKDEGNKEIILEFKELKRLVDSTQNNTRLMNQIKSMNRKIITLNQEVTLPNGDIMIFNLFENLIYSPAKRELKVKVTETFSYMINDLISHFTTFDLKTLVHLKSGYSKKLFKLLKQYEGGKDNKYPWYQIELKEFKELTGVPKDYPTRNLNTWVLKPIEKELSGIFKDFKIEKLTVDGKLVGRGKKTHSLKFSWKKETQKKKTELKKVIVQTEEVTVTKSELELYQEKISGLVMKLDKTINERLKINGEIGKCKTQKEIQKIVQKHNILL